MPSDVRRPMMNLAPAAIGSRYHPHHPHLPRLSRRRPKGRGGQSTGEFLGGHRKGRGHLLARKIEALPDGSRHSHEAGSRFPEGYEVPDLPLAPWTSRHAASRLDPNGRERNPPWHRTALWWVGYRKGLGLPEERVRARSAQRGRANSRHTRKWRFAFPCCSAPTIAPPNGADPVDLRKRIQAFPSLTLFYFEERGRRIRFGRRSSSNASPTLSCRLSTKSESRSFSPRTKRAVA